MASGECIQLTPRHLPHPFLTVVWFEQIDWRPWDSRLRLRSLPLHQVQTRDPESKFLLLPTTLEPVTWLSGLERSPDGPAIQTHDTALGKLRSSRQLRASGAQRSWPRTDDECVWTGFGKFAPYSS